MHRPPFMMQHSGSVPVVLAVVLCLLAPLASAQGCNENLPGVWDGYFNGVGAGESYNLSWSSNSSGAFLIEHQLPNPDPWSYALGRMAPDNASAVAVFPGRRGPQRHRLL
jgi:hypothetical protein